MTTRQDLVDIKSKALRNRIWFRDLSKIERAIVNLTIKCVETVRSPTLTKLLSGIVCKMLAAWENRFLSKAEKAGRLLAQNLGSIAEKWGNRKASYWKNDKTYIIYLGVNSIN